VNRSKDRVNLKKAVRNSEKQNNQEQSYRRHPHNSNKEYSWLGCFSLLIVGIILIGICIFFIFLQH
jgi:ATP-dependent Zn protease